MDYVISVAISAFKIEHLTVCHFRKASLGAATLRIMWKTKLDVIFLVKSVDICRVGTYYATVIDG
jgi:hypothetical protein